MSTIDYQAELTRGRRQRHGPLGRGRFFVRRYPLGAAGAVIMLLFVLRRALRAVHHHLRPALHQRRRLARAPSWAHWLGADFMGRDMYSRIVYGARISLIVAIGATALGSMVGVIVGLLVRLLRRLVRSRDAAHARDHAGAAAAGAGDRHGRRARARRCTNTIIAIAIPLVPYVARVIRSNTLSLREQPFVEAAKAIGMARARIAIRHVLPNTLAPLIVLATAQLGSTILIEAALSFLGLGVPEPHPSWGRMLSESAAEYVRTAPWLVIFPGVAISLVVFGTNLLGDALRDMLDPRQRS